MDKEQLPEIILLNERPFFRDLHVLFNSPQSTRLFLTITNKPSVWQDDLLICERFLGNMVICPYTSDSSMETHQCALELTQDVLKQRMKYPDIKEHPDLIKIAKTWVLRTKVSLGPDATHFLQPNPEAVHTLLEPVFTSLEIHEKRIHVLKVEVEDGAERQLLYKILDSGFRPSLLLVKWSFDLDDHIPTAHCSGHLLNSGYSLVSLSNNYALYYFSDQTIYDLCSMKTIGIKNPFMNTILESVNNITKSVPSTVSTTKETEEKTEEVTEVTEDTQTEDQ
jgi:hypothetical protein